MNTCLYCERTEIVARGMCQKHYRRLLRHGDPTVVKTITKKAPCHCGKPHFSLGLCMSHYYKQKRNKRLAAGLCGECGSPLDQDKTICSKCSRVRSVKWKERKLG